MMKKQSLRTANDGLSLKKAYGESSFNRLVRQYKANAKRRGIGYSLTDGQVRSITSSACIYCGKEPSQVMLMKDANGPYVYSGIDRVDSKRGYVIGNCVPCCRQCNAAKSNMRYSEWILFIRRLVNYWTEGVDARDFLSRNFHRSC